MKFWLPSGAVFAPKCTDELAPEERVDEFRLPSGLTFAPECAANLCLSVLIRLHLWVSMNFGS